MVGLEVKLTTLGLHCHGFLCQDLRECVLWTVCLVNYYIIDFETWDGIISGTTVQNLGQCLSARAGIYLSYFPKTKLVQYQLLVEHLRMPPCVLDVQCIETGVRIGTQQRDTLASLQRG